MEHLHSNGIILRSIDPQGILMTESMNPETSVPRIARLDKAHVMGLSEDEHHTRGCFGDIRFRAPEVLANKPYNFKADAWSFGVILFLLLTGKLPFDSGN